MEQYFDLLQKLFSRYGTLIVFPLLILENFPFVGFFTPAITILVIAGFTLGGNTFLLLKVSVVAYLGIVVGDNIWFFIGRYSAKKWKFLESISSRSEEVMEVINDQGTLVKLLYQFPPYFRMFLPFGFGASKTTIREWLFINLIGSTLYVSLFMGIGFFSFKTVKGLSKANTIGQQVSNVIIVLSILYLIYLVRQYWKKIQSR